MSETRRVHLYVTHHRQNLIVLNYSFVFRSSFINSCNLINALEEYLKFATFSKDLFVVCMLWF